jgi:hypothetical protein
VQILRALLQKGVSHSDHILLACGGGGPGSGGTWLHEELYDRCVWALCLRVRWRQHDASA